jgi:Chalcone isomerase-like
MIKKLVFSSLLLVLSFQTWAAETVSLSGSGVRFSTTTDYLANAKSNKMALTGVAMRSKFLVNVYAIASYVQEGIKPKSSDELINADIYKQLNLVMERQVDGREMAASFKSSVLLNHKEEEFPEELTLLDNLFKEIKVVKGDQVKLTHLPGVGIHCQVVDKIEVTIKSVAFSKAIWEIYFGKNNLGESIKKSLLSKL